MTKKVTHAEIKHVFDNQGFLGIRVEWFGHSDFGEVDLYIDREDGFLKCDDNGLGRDFVKEIFQALVEDALFTNEKGVQKMNQEQLILEARRMVALVTSYSKDSEWAQIYPEMYEIFQEAAALLNKALGEEHAFSWKEERKKD